jgi:hypothetical protein
MCLSEACASADLLCCLVVGVLQDVHVDQ